MTLNIREANSLNTLLRWLLDIEKLDFKKPDNVEASQAAEWLAGRAHIVLGAGLTHNTVIKAWPAQSPTVEVKRLRARVEELEPFEPRLRDMHMGPGGWSMTITQAKGASAGFVAAAKAMLDGHDAENYVEQEVFLGETLERYMIIYVRPGKKGPHQLRREADATLDEIRATHQQVLDGDLEPFDAIAQVGRILEGEDQE